MVLSLILLGILLGVIAIWFRGRIPRTPRGPATQPTSLPVTQPASPVDASVG